MKKIKKFFHDDTGLLILQMLPYGIAALVICLCFTLIWGFDAAVFIGFGIGFLFACASLVYLGMCCESSVSLDVKKGKRRMLCCYLIRYFSLFGLCALSMFSGKISVVGILVPQFFPKIILSIMQWRGKIGRKENV